MSLEESWRKTRAHLDAARSAVAEGSDLKEFAEYLDHNELQLAADALLALGNEQEFPATFWLSLQMAYESMQLGDAAVLCRSRADEAGREKV